ncbi:MAG: ankyrin repeat domain-containing protein [Halieaceae bacterium]|nr:ankyrin repeat domain-containing protein [Halieaceae bacterium]
MVQSIPAQIVNAIKVENCELIIRLFKENLEQVNFYTPFGGHTWLGYAAQIGKLESVKTLVNIGISINTGDKRDNVLPICCAAGNGHVHIVEYFLDVGTDLDVSESIRNALFSAIIGRSVEIVKKLLNAGIDSKVSYDSKTMKSMDATAFALMRGEQECALAIALWNTNGNEEAAKLELSRAHEVAEKNAY